MVSNVVNGYRSVGYEPVRTLWLPVLYRAGVRFHVKKVCEQIPPGSASLSSFSLRHQASEMDMRPSRKTVDEQRESRAEQSRAGAASTNQRSRSPRRKKREK